MIAWRDCGQVMGVVKSGGIVTLSVGAKAGGPDVVVREPIDGRVQLRSCGTGRCVAEWLDVSSAHRRR